MTVSSEVKHVAKALLAEASVQVNGGVHDHVVMAQRGVRVAFVQSVVDQQRAAVVVSHPSSDVDNRVLMDAKQRLEPDHDGAFAHRFTVVVGPAAALGEVLWQVHAVMFISALIYSCSAPAEPRTRDHPGSRFGDFSSGFDWVEQATVRED
jgi:hypothetical protein